MKRLNYFSVVCFLLLGAAARADLLGRYYGGVQIDPNGIIQTSALTESFSRFDANIDYWNGSSGYAWQPVPGYANAYTVEWSGFVRIEIPGEYGFGTISDDGSQIWIDNKLIVDNGESQWYDWEDNITEYDPGEPNLPVYLDQGYHSIMVRFYEGGVYDGIELWWLLPDSGPSDIPYYGTNFHGTPPTYNPNTNWSIVPPEVLITPDDFNLMVCGMDLNGDDVINLYEFSVFAAEWQIPTPTYADLTGDGNVKLDDLAEFMSFWLQVCQE